MSPLIAPLRLHRIMFLKPACIMSFAIATPAAPAPDITVFVSPGFLFTILSAFFSPARATTAVPCWSSWKIGMSQHFFSFCSISKQRGAAMSSRLMPPKLPASRLTVFTISSVSFERMHSGIASISPKLLNSTHLPSITGIPASGPMSPSPSTAVPSVTTATVFHRLVSENDSSLSCCIARHGAATPGVYATDSSSRVDTAARLTTSILPFHSACFSIAILP